MKIAVLGSNSFSGSDFIDSLLNWQGNEVIGISRSPEKSVLYLPYKQRENPKFEFYRMDMNKDMPQIVGLLDSFKPEYVVNFAAQSEVAPSWKYPEQWMQTNVVALTKLANALKDRKYLRRYVHISTPEVYGTVRGECARPLMNPSTPYAASKAAADLFLATLVKQYGFPCVTIRSANVYGAHQQLWKIIPRTIIYLKMGNKIQLHGGGHQERSFIHIRDVSCGEHLAMLEGVIGAVYHLAPRESRPIRDVVGRVCAFMGHRFGEVTESVGQRPGQDMAYVLDSGLARQHLGWEPLRSLNDGIRDAIRWVEDNWEQIRKEPLEYVHKE
jgi:dTDP-glucose 4,6-dehydratase